MNFLKEIVKISKNCVNVVEDIISSQDNEANNNVMPEMTNYDDKSQTVKNTVETISKDTHTVAITPNKTNRTLANTNIINVESDDDTSSNLYALKKILNHKNFTVKRCNNKNFEDLLPTHNTPESSSNSKKDTIYVEEYKTTDDNLLSDDIEIISIFEDLHDRVNSSEVQNTSEETKKCLSEFDRILAEVQVKENHKATNYKARTIEDETVINTYDLQNAKYHENTYNCQEIKTSNVQSFIQDTEILHSIFGDKDISQLLQMDIPGRSHDLKGPDNVVESKDDIISISSESDDDLISSHANMNIAENCISTSKSYKNAIGDVPATNESNTTSLKDVLVESDNDNILTDSQFCNAPKTHNNTKMVDNDEFRNKSKQHLNTIKNDNITSEMNESHLKTITVSVEKEDDDILFDSEINNILNCSDTINAIVKEVSFNIANEWGTEMSSEIKLENSIMNLDSKQILVEDNKGNVKYIENNTEVAVSNVTQNSVAVDSNIKEDEKAKRTENNNLHTISLGLISLNTGTGYESDDDYHSSYFEFITEEEAKKEGLITNIKSKSASPRDKSKRKITTRKFVQNQSYRGRDRVQDDPYAAGYSQRYTEQYENRKEVNVNHKLNKTMENDPYGPGPSSRNLVQVNDDNKGEESDEGDESYKVPSESKFLNMFRDLPPMNMSEIHYLENKSLWARVPMLVQYDGIGFDMNLALHSNESDASDEDTEEARETKRKILQMYPQGNS